ncbi:MAG TPA: hypothetical protein VMG99_08685 [Thermoplasmata archaeon]|nr:hypothetical protein [Thermoplasmata archaeon]
MDRAEAEAILRRMSDLNGHTYAQLREYAFSASGARLRSREELLRAIDREVSYLGELRRRVALPPPVTTPV